MGLNRGVCCPQHWTEPKSNSPRGCEIEEYLIRSGYHDIFWSEEEQKKYMLDSDIENYLIIDDDSDMLYHQRNHFVHVLPSPRNKSGFNKKYLKEAIRKLSVTSLELNY